VEAGIAGKQFDKDQGADHDCTTPLGFRRWVDAACATVFHAVLWFGTQCSSFVGMSKSHLKRSVENDFLGDISRSFVVVGNALCEVSSFLYFFGYLVDCLPLLEQPANSVLPKL